MCRHRLRRRDAREQAMDEYENSYDEQTGRWTTAGDVDRIEAAAAAGPRFRGQVSLPGRRAGSWRK